VCPAPSISSVYRQYCVPVHAHGYCVGLITPAVWRDHRSAQHPRQHGGTNAVRSAQFGAGNLSTPPSASDGFIVMRWSEGVQELTAVHLGLSKMGIFLAALRCCLIVRSLPSISTLQNCHGGALCHRSMDWLALTPEPSLERICPSAIPITILGLRMERILTNTICSTSWCGHPQRSQRAFHGVY